MYQHIDGNHWRHIWIVGDLHGCYQQLLQVLRARHFNPYKDLLICVGDVIDRGPDSWPCLQLLQKSWCQAVRGNHEQMAIDALRVDDMALWFLNGGTWFHDVRNEEQQQVREALCACDRLPYIIELQCASGIHVIAHADYPAEHYAWGQSVDKASVLWRRERLNAHFAGRNVAISGADHFWFGHTPLKQRIDVDNVHYIDTGAVFGGELTLAQVQ